jgi:hypothetical protein
MDGLGRGWPLSAGRQQAPIPVRKEKIPAVSFLPSRSPFSQPSMVFGDAAKMNLCASIDGLPQICSASLKLWMSL